MNCSRQRESPTPPQLVEGRHADLAEREATDHDALHTTRKALRRLVQEIARRAAEDQEPCRAWVSVRQDPEYRKGVGAMLHFVDDDQVAQRPEGRHRLAETCEARGILESRP